MRPFLIDSIGCQLSKVRLHDNRSQSMSMLSEKQMNTITKKIVMSLFQHKLYPI
jgi:hypothetical protein